MTAVDFILSCLFHVSCEVDGSVNIETKMATIKRRKWAISTLVMDIGDKMFW